MTTHSLEIPVYHVARMEVVETLSNVDQLVMGVRMRKHNKRDAHQCKSVRIRMFLNVFPQFSS